MRIFVGIKINKDLRCKIEDWKNTTLALRVTPPILGGDELSLRWMKPENLHITLVPPWDMEEKNLQAISNKLKAVNCKPFEISFNKVEYGPNKKSPSLIWVSGQSPAEIKDLRLKLYKALGKEAENRKYNLHCTLARFKETPLIELHQEVEWRMKVDRFVLYESKLLPEGAEYEVIEEFGIRYKVV